MGYRVFPTDFSTRCAPVEITARQKKPSRMTAATAPFTDGPVRQIDENYHSIVIGVSKTHKDKSKHRRRWDRALPSGLAYFIRRRSTVDFTDCPLAKTTDDDENTKIN